MNNLSFLALTPKKVETKIKASSHSLLEGFNLNIQDLPEEQ
ncbi:hypothetical protein [Mucilaginibacter gotjawali]|uniref:Uncharacterized protein n=2 Tax=Mucilaginibacter gotjawali TaxID=1550579 RepID=A0A839SM08_9SPHI|nr:hypothetical protein [Mucilaginibacter gotjawali]MBB3058274.1 hypothetical protein [Mucilaginibacter gotjawali]BAU55607.1 hypothetical protein MgSA37_03798 [Mucilaginibacter gotjawali]